MGGSRRHQGTLHVLLVGPIITPKQGPPPVFTSTRRAHADQHNDGAGPRRHRCMICWYGAYLLECKHPANSCGKKADIKYSSRSRSQRDNRTRGRDYYKPAHAQAPPNSSHPHSVNRERSRRAKGPRCHEGNQRPEDGSTAGGSYSNSGSKAPWYNYRAYNTPSVTTRDGGQ